MSSLNTVLPGGKRMKRKVLKTERNTQAMQARVLRAFRRWYGTPILGIHPQADFEHGQWWITNVLSGRQWSVVDAEGGRAVDGFDFEMVTNGDDDE